MKRLAMLVIGLTVSGSSTTVMEVPDGMVIAIFKQTCLDQAVVDCGTQTVKVPAISTGPFILKATNGDCYRLPYVNPNGTPSKSPFDWIRCP